MKRLLLALLLLAASAQADSSVFSVTIDTYIDSVNPTTNFGNADTMMIKYLSTGAAQRGLLRPPNIRDSILPTAIVDSATWYLTNKTASSKIFKIARLLKPFVEDTATHLIWATAKEWGTPGARNLNSTDCGDAHNTTDGGGYDYEGPITTVTTSGTANTLNRFPFDTCHIYDWVQSRDSIDGIVMWTETHLANVRFWTSDAAEAGYRPKLVVWWHTTGVPNYRHSPAGGAVRHSPAGGSVRHKP